MRQLNADHRGKNRTTDVLSFEANIPVGRKTLYPVLGDVVINVQMAASQAKKSGKNFYDEIYHLLVHGILHLLGYDHEKSKYKSLIMRKKEQEILDAVKKMG